MVLASLVGALGVTALAGCGRSASPDGASGAGGDGPAGTVARTADLEDWGQGTEPPAGWTFGTPDIDVLRAGADDRSLVVEAGFEPVRLDDRSCAGEAGGWVDEGQPGIVYVFPRTVVPNVLADESLGRWADRFGPCKRATPTIELALSAPLGDADVLVDGVRWVRRAGSDDYERCELPACDPEQGGTPQLATCDDGAALVDDVRTLGDVPRHSDIGETRCEDGWAMVEVDVGSGACPATGDGPNPCAGERFDRLFLRAGTPHWEVIGRTREAGCGDIADVEPDFPPSLCDDRPTL